MNTVKYIFFFSCIIFIFFLGCDGAASVKGKIVDQTGNKYESCYLELFLEKENFSVGEQKISSPFLTTFTIAPYGQKYFFTISCEGASENFKSQEIILGNSDYVRHPIDLGTIILKRN